MPVIFALFLSLLFVSSLQAKSVENANGEWFNVAKNTYVFRYKFYFTLFVKTDKGVVAFDPLSNEAAASYAKAIKEALPGAKLRAIVYTHWHTDHSTGANVLRSEFGRDVPIIAHENTYKKLRNLDNKNVPLPTKMVSDKGLVLKDTGNPIQLKYIGYAHTDTMLVVYLPKQKLVFAVDFVNHDSMGWRDLPGVDIDELILMQKVILALDFKIIAFGHGRPGGRDVVIRQIAYYKALLVEAKKAIHKGWSEDQAAKNIILSQYKGWDNYKRWFMLNVRGAYRFQKRKLENK